MKAETAETLISALKGLTMLAQVGQTIFLLWFWFWHTDIHFILKIVAFMLSEPVAAWIVAIASGLIAAPLLWIKVREGESDF